MNSIKKWSLSVLIFIIKKFGKETYDEKWSEWINYKLWPFSYNNHVAAGNFLYIFDYNLINKELI